MPTAEEILEDAGKGASYVIAPGFLSAYEAWKETEHSLQESVEKLEEQHKLLLATLALTNNTYCNMFKKFHPIFAADKKKGIDFTKSPDYQTIVKLGQQIFKSAGDWLKTQTDLEKQAHIPKVDLSIHDFLDPKKAVKILKLAQTFFKKGVSGMEISDSIRGDGSGIGNPVIAIVWAAALITAGISIAYIVHRLTISTQDRIDLLNATKQTCIDLKLSPTECAGVINTAQVEETKNSKGVTDAAEAVGSGFAKILFVGAALFIGLQLIKNKKATT